MTRQTVKRRRVCIAVGTGCRRSRLIASQKLQHLLSRFIQADTEIIQNSRRHAFSFTNQSEKYVFCSHIRMS
ncbi:DUF1205 domain-containing protein [Bacillus amyloliquefaciens]|nr:DUF1205 domain-containing protein [Bacillus velezensis]MCR6616821.1 DUF1205 domain-containing protein [Bacillus amyloliquefaciens]UBM15982.1 DUF1205 domain-containing protein [Bacillus velezensis]UBM47819.1 DUF1205 domain-containing protein [Bacillus velezensis]UBM56959.1 DUF1205 domain-containing protein [Bacillus velezensis]